jgi:hypothetical protein
MRKSLIINRYLKSNEIQKVMWNDIKHDLLLKFLIKSRTLTIKRFFHLSQRFFFSNHHGSSGMFGS